MVRAPGRVNLLGAHVDYSEGLVLPATIDRAVYLAASPRADSRLTLLALDIADDGAAEIDLAALPSPVAERPGAATGGWADLPAAVAWSLRREGIDPGGLDVVYGGDLPMGAGVSSSAAVEMALLLAWAPELDATRRALLGQRAENDYLGVRSGIMDQYAIVHGRADTALLLDCRSLEHRAIPLPGDCTILLFDSGVRRRLVASGFNDRRAECAAAVEILGRHLPGTRTLRDVTVADLARHGDRLPPVLRRRAEHAVHEIARVAAAAADLERGDLAAFGRAMRRSHESSRDLYETSIPELDLLAATAWATPGCHGARLAGGGFGGCVTALVATDGAERVAEAVAARFAQVHGRRPPVHRCRAAAGAAVCSLSR